MANKFIRIVGWSHSVSFHFVSLRTGSCRRSLVVARNSTRRHIPQRTWRCHSVAMAAKRMHIAHPSRLPTWNRCDSISRLNACHLRNVHCLNSVRKRRMRPAGVKLLHTKANRWRWQWPIIRCTMRKVIMTTMTTMTTMAMSKQKQTVSLRSRKRSANIVLSLRLCLVFGDVKRENTNSKSNKITN